MKCPRCGFVSSPQATRCGCGHAFASPKSARNGDRGFAFLLGLAFLGIAVVIFGLGFGYGIWQATTRQPVTVKVSISGLMLVSLFCTLSLIMLSVAVFGSEAHMKGSVAKSFIAVVALVIFWILHAGLFGFYRSHGYPTQEELFREQWKSRP